MRSVIHKILGLCEDAVVFVVMLPFALWRFARWLGSLPRKAHKSLKWRQSVTILPIVRGDQGSIWSHLEPLTRARDTYRTLSCIVMEETICLRHSKNII